MGTILVPIADHFVDNVGQRIRTNALYALIKVFVCVDIASQRIHQRNQADPLIVNQRIDNLFNRVSYCISTHV